MSATGRGAATPWVFWRLQSGLLDPIPCRACGMDAEPHLLANDAPPNWVMAHGPKCGDPVYAPTREGVVEMWNEVQKEAAC